MAEPNKPLRPSALERLSSPEQLDELIHVTQPRSWVALLVIGILLLAALGWGVFGRLPTKVHGEGMLLRGERLFKITALGNGQLQGIRVGPGTIVTNGQLVATIQRPQLVEQIASARSQLGELKRQHAILTEFEAKDTVREIELMALKKTNLGQLIKDYEEQDVWLKEKIGNQERLLDQGLITKQTLLVTRQSRYTVLQQIESSKSELKEMANKQFQLANQKEQGMLASQLTINDTERRLQELDSELELSTKVTSSHAGRILEVMVKPGDLLSAGSPLFNLEPTDSDLKAVVYLDAGEGKRVIKGMEAQVIPSSYTKEEHGYMLAKVDFVADYPATRQAMMSVLENDQLVQHLSTDGAPITLYVTLVKDQTSKSGFRWSSPKGPPTEIHSGTVCKASIVVEERRPITLVIPGLRGLFGP